ncbi:hypothetical protein BCL76_1328 [Streptomyces sp. CG 926]|nr:hypothetical protein BCL76_1328 [Streptomyces sp. CG 926]
MLRLVDALPEPAVPAPRVVGVDEYATRKGRRYGTHRPRGRRNPSSGRPAAGPRGCDSGRVAGPGPLRGLRPGPRTRPRRRRRELLGPGSGWSAETGPRSSAKVRTEVNTPICMGVYGQLSEGLREQLPALLSESDTSGTTKYNRLKQAAKAPTWSHFRAQAEHLGWVDELGETGCGSSASPRGRSRTSPVRRTLRTGRGA